MAEITDRLLTAPTEAFERHGYDRTKTAKIANRAAVAEALIFSHFGTKSNLAKEAVFAALDQHFRAFTANHVVSLDDLEGMPVEVVQHIRELQDFLASQSWVLMSLDEEQLYVSGTGQEKPRPFPGWKNISLGPRRSPLIAMPTTQ